MTWQRSTFKPQRPAPARPDRSDEFRSFQPMAATARMATAIDLVPGAVKPPRAVMQKTPDRKQQAIRESARDEPCTVRLPGCPSDPAMSIWSHNRHQRAGKGGAIKALDLNGCVACTHCDAIYDGQAPLPAGMTREAVELAWYHGHAESLVRLRQKGLV